jgi:hypothetical protein
MKIIPLLYVLLLGGCNRKEPAIAVTVLSVNNNLPGSAVNIGSIALPAGYKRLDGESGSFGEWLRTIPLRKDKTVYLYNGRPKDDQSVQFAVLDIAVGTKDLQQCADAVMRLRADYLFAQKRYSEIIFKDNNNKAYKWEGGSDRRGFEHYLENVFGWCGSASLEKQLTPVTDVATIQPGDVFIKGGFPGHAMIVSDVAVNNNGERIFLLAQSYMPAQDIHVVNSPADEWLGPWYKMNEVIYTPEWTFTKHQLRRW